MSFGSSLFWCQQGYDLSLASTSETMLLPFLCVLAYEASGFWCVHMEGGGMSQGQEVRASETANK